MLEEASQRGLFLFSNPSLDDSLQNAYAMVIYHKQGDTHTMADEPKAHAQHPQTEPAPQVPVQPEQQYAQPTPEQQQVPYEQQPVQQQYFAQPNAAPVQYVIAQQSLKGLRGWLLFFTIVSGLAALTYVGMLVSAFSAFSAERVADVIFLPILLAAAIGSVVLVALEKQIAKYVFIGFYGAAFLYGIINSAIIGVEVAPLITSILVGGLWVLFVTLYFLTSKRVKETLIK